MSLDVSRVIVCFSIAGSTAGVEGDQFSPDWLLTELSEYFEAWLPGPQLESFRQESYCETRRSILGSDCPTLVDICML